MYAVNIICGCKHSHAPQEDTLHDIPLEVLFIIKTAIFLSNICSVPLLTKSTESQKIVGILAETPSKEHICTLVEREGKMCQQTNDAAD